MAKNITINNYDKPNMAVTLHKGIQEASEDKLRYTYGYYGGDDCDFDVYGLSSDWFSDSSIYDDDSYEDGELSKERQKRLKELEDAFGFTKVKRHKSRKRHKKAKKIKDGDYDDDEVNFGNKEIYFYRDVSDKYDYEVFKSLYEFDDFCETEGINVPEKEIENLMNRCVSYCCIDDAYSRFIGEQTLITSPSYTDLVWDYASSVEQFIDEK